MKKSIIGRFYTPIDNSWSANLSKSLHDSYSGVPIKTDGLAGASNKKAETCKILTDPFKVSIPWCGKVTDFDFVILLHNDEQHIQLFHEDGLLPKVIVENQG